MNKYQLFHSLKVTGARQIELAMPGLVPGILVFAW
jgi:hypothetical protein